MTLLDEADLYEASITVRTFETREEAEAWIDETIEDEDEDGIEEEDDGNP